MTDASDLGKAREAQHESLAERFSGKLAPLTPVAPIGPETPDPVQEAPAAVTEKVATARSGKPRSAPKRTTPTTDSVNPQLSGGEGAKATEAIQVSLPKSLYERYLAYKQSSGLSHPNILFDAIEATANELPDLVKANAIEVGGTGRQLFNRRRTVTVHTDDAEPRETFIVRISGENKAIIADLVSSTGAPSRNALFIAAYEAFVPTADH